MKKPTSKKQLSRLVIEGFKSIAKCDIELGCLNVLIGCNGAGKSNVVSFFHMVEQLLAGNLQKYVSKEGGPDSLLHFGRKTTESLKAELYFGQNAYKIALEPTSDNRMMFQDETFWWIKSGDWPIGSGHFETRVESQKGSTGIYEYTVPAMRSWRVYHFHDTGDSSPMKRRHAINDNAYLRVDARNLAAYLYSLHRRDSQAYGRILKTIRLVAPFFGDFFLRPSLENEDMIELEWVEAGQDTPFKAHHLSDGTLRFICLATVFMQPPDLQPETILVDEPELGLHPYAITVLASLMRSVAKSKQVIISTQSVDLLNEFDPEDVIVVDREDGRSVLRRLGPPDLGEWLDEYTLGELWKKNILGGRPSR